jgi:hypothetical protein
MALLGQALEKIEYPVLTRLIGTCDELADEE